jgi:hypothetical protein
VPKRYDNIICKLFLRSKIIKVILSSITRIGLIICIEDPKEVPSGDYIHIENTEVEETTIVDIATTIYFVGSNVIFIISLDTS